MKIEVSLDLDIFPLTLPLFVIDIPKDEIENARDAVQCEIDYNKFDMEIYGTR